MSVVLTGETRTAGGTRRGGLALDGVMAVVGGVAAVLMVCEAVILFAGVIARYVLDSPLIWSDEVASILFIWLGMLGAALALHRGQHMRLTALLTRLPTVWAQWLETVAWLVVLAFLATILYPAIEHVQEQYEVLSPVLSIPDSYRVAAMPAGIGLMIVVALAKLARSVRGRTFWYALATVAVLAALLWLARGGLMHMGNYNLLVFFVFGLVACLLAGVPIAMGFGAATVAYLVMATSMPLPVVIGRMDEGMSSLVLLSIPLFILLGVLLQISGMAKTLIDFMGALVGHKRGGLDFVLLGAMFLISGISGSKAADMAAVAPALLPEMEKRGARPEALVALLSASGAMTETIPPSLVLIAIGAVCNVSIAALFDGGLVPALIATLAIGTVCALKARRVNLALPGQASGRVVLRTFAMAVPVLILPVLIRLAVADGVATATEVSTVGVAYVLVVGLAMHAFTRHIAWRTVYPMLVDATALAGAILLIIGTATAMAWALTQSGFSFQLIAVIRQMPGGAAGFLAMSMVLFIVLGSLLEGLPAIVLFGPILFPIARTFGVADVHYAMVMILGMGMGLFAPPFGVGFYSACAIARVSPDRVVARMGPYLGALLVALIVVTAFPVLSRGMHF